MFIVIVVIIIIVITGWDERTFGQLFEILSRGRGSLKLSCAREAFVCFGSLPGSKSPKTNTHDLPAFGMT